MVFGNSLKMQTLMVSIGIFLHNPIRITAFPVCAGGLYYLICLPMFRNSFDIIVSSAMKIMALFITLQLHNNLKVNSHAFYEKNLLGLFLLFALGQHSLAQHYNDTRLYDPGNVMHDE